MSRVLNSPPAVPYGMPVWRDCASGWPNSSDSLFWETDGFVWHVQRFGKGPPLLLLHGSGAATHSWRQMAAYFKKDFEIISVDLPGHGFTQSPAHFRPGLENVARAIGGLLQVMQVAPEGIVGHSAGVAIAITMADLGLIAPRVIVSINGALQPFSGPLSIAAPLLAKLISATSGPAWFIAKRAINKPRVERLIRDTGSDPARIDTHLYQMLLGYPGHIRGTLQMMAHWELSEMTAACARLRVPALFISAERDRAVGSGIAARAARTVCNGTHLNLKRLGHLAHEEDGDIVAKAFLTHWAAHSGD